MKKLFALTVLISILLFVGIAQAATPTWFTGTVKSVYPLADGRYVIIFNEDSPSCDGTPGNKYHYVGIGENGVTADAAKYYFSTALTALTTGKPLSINFDADSSGCFINRMYISAN